MRMLAALRRDQMDWGRGFLAAPRSHRSPSLAPQLSRRRDGMGRDGGALAAGERSDPAKAPRVGWSRPLAALAGPQQGRGGLAARLPPAGSGGAPRCAVSRPPATPSEGHPPSAPACPATADLGGILHGGGKGRAPKARDGVPGAVGTAVYLHRPGPS